MTSNRSKAKSFTLATLALVSLLVAGLAPQTLTLSLNFFPLNLSAMEEVINPTSIELSQRISPFFTTAAANVGRIKLVVDLGDRQVHVYRYNAIKKSYAIAIGKPGWETPTGEFSVDHLDPNPAWVQPITGEVIPPGDDNPLGKRWIGFWSDGIHQIGFHGTAQQAVIGEAVSHGCLRMKNEDIVELYEQIDLDTIVIVQE